MGSQVTLPTLTQNPGTQASGGATLAAAAAAGQSLFTAASQPNFDFDATFQALSRQVSQTSLSPQAQQDYLSTAVNTYLQQLGGAYGSNLATHGSGQGFTTDAAQTVANLRQTGLFNEQQLAVYTQSLEAGYRAAGGTLPTGYVPGQALTQSQGTGRGGGVSGGTTTTNATTTGGGNNVLPTAGEPGKAGDFQLSGANAAKLGQLVAGNAQVRADYNAYRDNLYKNLLKNGAPAAAAAAFLKEVDTAYFGAGGTVGTSHGGTTNTNTNTNTNTTGGGGASTLAGAPTAVLGLANGGDPTKVGIELWTQSLQFYQSATPAQQQALVDAFNRGGAGSGDALRAAAAKIGTDSLTPAQVALQSLPLLQHTTPPAPAAVGKLLAQAGRGDRGPVTDADIAAAASWLQGQPEAVKNSILGGLGQAALSHPGGQDFSTALNGAVTQANAPVDPNAVSDPQAKAILTDRTIADASQITYPAWQATAAWLKGQDQTARGEYLNAISTKFGASSPVTLAAAALVQSLNTDASKNTPIDKLAATTFPAWNTDLNAGPALNNVTIGGHTYSSGTGGTSGASGSSSTGGATSGLIDPARRILSQSQPISGDDWNATVKWWSGLPTGTAAQQAYKASIKDALNAAHPAKTDGTPPRQGAGDALQYASDSIANQSDDGTKNSIINNYFQNISDPFSQLTQPGKALSAADFNQAVKAWAALPTDTPEQQSYRQSVKAALNAAFPGDKNAKPPTLGAGDALQYAADTINDKKGGSKDDATKNSIITNYFNQVQTRHS